MKKYRIYYSYTGFWRVQKKGFLIWTHVDSFVTKKAAQSYVNRRLAFQKKYYYPPFDE